MSIASKSLAVEPAGQLSFPSSVSSDWLTVNKNSLGTVTTFSQPVTLDPDSSWASDGSYAGMYAFKREQGRGTNILTRMLYPSDATITTPFKFVLVGRKTPVSGATASQSTRAWQILLNRAGTAAVTIVAAPTTDLQSDSGVSQTTVDISVNVHDNLGCDEFAIIPIQNLAATFSGGGAVAQALFQVKTI